MKVIILRGLPGSGKSTYAKSLKGYNILCSADDYHMVNGEYKYKKENMGEAHQACLKLFLDYCKEENAQDVDNLVVDNTNTTSLEFSTYIKIAEVYGYEIELLEFECDIETSFNRNLHNVPLFAIEKMANNLKEPIPNQFRKYLKLLERK